MLIGFCKLWQCAIVRRCTHSEIKIKATDTVLRKQPTTTARLQHTFECIHRSTDAAPSLPTCKDTVAICVNMSVIELLGKKQNIERAKPTRPSMNA